MNVDSVLSNVGLLLSTVFLVVFVLIRKEVSLALMRKFFKGKGWVTIRMWMPDRQEREAFINLKKNPTLNFFGRAFIYDAKAMTFKAAIPEEAEEKKDGKEEKKELLDSYNIRLESLTKTGKFPVLNYRWDRADPIDPYNLEAKTDSALLNAAVIRAKAQGGISDFLKQNKRLILFVMIAAGLAAAAAYFGYEVNQTLQEILMRGEGL